MWLICSEIDRNRIDQTIDKINNDKRISEAEERELIQFLMKEVPTHPWISNQHYLENLHMTHDDLVSELVLSIWEKIRKKKFNPKLSRLETYITMVIRSHIDWLMDKTKKKTEIPHKDLISIFEEIGTEFEGDAPLQLSEIEDNLPTPEEQAKFRRMWGAIEKDIKRKPQLVQEIFRLRTKEELKIVEIAEALKKMSKDEENEEFKEQIKNIHSNTVSRIISDEIVPIVEKHSKDA